MEKWRGSGGEKETAQEGMKNVFEDEIYCF
jgi:hypothetical protein